MDFSRELGFGADKSLLDDMAGANGTKAFLTSPAFWAVQAAVAASFLLIKRVAGRYGGPSAGAAGVEDTNNLYEERMENLVMHWHLSNALIWSFFFDALSGLFAVLPKMRVIYYKLDARHLLDIDMRAGLDAVYWAELCIHVPLCYIAFLLHLYKRPSRGVIDVAVSGIQLCGCFIYYVSGVYDNGKYWFNGEPVIFFTGTVLGGLAWMIVPMLVIWRHMRLEAERHGHQRDSCSEADLMPLMADDSVAAVVPLRELITLAHVAYTNEFDSALLGQKEVAARFVDGDGYDNPFRDWIRERRRLAGDDAADDASDGEQHEQRQAATSPDAMPADHVGDLTPTTRNRRAEKRAALKHIRDELSRPFSSGLKTRATNKRTAAKQLRTFLVEGLARLIASIYLRRTSEACFSQSNGAGPASGPAPPVDLSEVWSTLETVTVRWAFPHFVLAALWKAAVAAAGTDLGTLIQQRYGRAAVITGASLGGPDEQQKIQRLAKARSPYLPDFRVWTNLAGTVSHLKIALQRNEVVTSCLNWTAFADAGFTSSSCYFLLDHLDSQLRLGVPTPSSSTISTASAAGVDFLANEMERQMACRLFSAVNSGQAAVSGNAAALSVAHAAAMLRHLRERYGPRSGLSTPGTNVGRSVAFFGATPPPPAEDDGDEVSDRGLSSADGLDLRPPPPPLFTPKRLLALLSFPTQLLPPVSKNKSLAMNSRDKVSKTLEFAAFAIQDVDCVEETVPTGAPRAGKVDDESRGFLSEMLCLLCSPNVADFAHDAVGGAGGCFAEGEQGCYVYLDLDDDEALAERAEEPWPIVSRVSPAHALRAAWSEAKSRGTRGAGDADEEDTQWATFFLREFRKVRERIEIEGGVARSARERFAWDPFAYPAFVEKLLLAQMLPNLAQKNQRHCAAQMIANHLAVPEKARNICALLLRRHGRPDAAQADGLGDEAPADRIDDGGAGATLGDESAPGGVVGGPLSLRQKAEDATFLQNFLEYLHEKTATSFHDAQDSVEQQSALVDVEELQRQIFGADKQHFAVLGQELWRGLNIASNCSNEEAGCAAGPSTSCPATSSSEPEPDEAARLDISEHDHEDELELPTVGVVAAADADEERSFLPGAGSANANQESALNSSLVSSSCVTCHYCASSVELDKVATEMLESEERVLAEGGISIASVFMLPQLVFELSKPRVWDLVSPHVEPLVGTICVRMGTRILFFDVEALQWTLQKSREPDETASEMIAECARRLRKLLVDGHASRLSLFFGFDAKQWLLLKSFLELGGNGRNGSSGLDSGSFGGNNDAMKMIIRNFVDVQAVVQRLLAPANDEKPAQAAGPSARLGDVVRNFGLRDFPLDEHGRFSLGRSHQRGAHSTSPASQLQPPAPPFVHYCAERCYILEAVLCTCLRMERLCSPAPAPPSDPTTTPQYENGKRNLLADCMHDLNLSTCYDGLLNKRGKYSSRKRPKSVSKPWEQTASTDAAKVCAQLASLAAPLEIGGNSNYRGINTLEEWNEFCRVLEGRIVDQVSSCDDLAEIFRKDAQAQASKLVAQTMHAPTTGAANGSCSPSSSTSCGASDQQTEGTETVATTGVEKMANGDSGTLSIERCRAELVAHVGANSVSCVLGATGSGKSTKLPQYLYDERVQFREIEVPAPSGGAGEGASYPQQHQTTRANKTVHPRKRDFHCLVVQPRRHAAEALAGEMRRQMLEKYATSDKKIHKKVVGYRFGNKSDFSFSRTSILFTTYGFFWEELVGVLPTLLPKCNSWPSGGGAEESENGDTQHASAFFSAGGDNSAADGETTSDEDGSDAEGIAISRTTNSEELSVSGTQHLPQDSDESEQRDPSAPRPRTRSANNLTREKLKQIVPYTHIILDEIHEHSIVSWLVLYALQRIFPILVYLDVKIVMMSATMEPGCLLSFLVSSGRVQKELVGRYNAAAGLQEFLKLAREKYGPDEQESEMSVLLRGEDGREEYVAGSAGKAEMGAEADARANDAQDESVARLPSIPEHQMGECDDIAAGAAPSGPPEEDEQASFLTANTSVDASRLGHEVEVPSQAGEILLGSASGQQDYEYDKPETMPVGLIRALRNCGDRANLARLVFHIPGERPYPVETMYLDDEVLTDLFPGLLSPCEKDKGQGSEDDWKPTVCSLNGLYTILAREVEAAVAAQAGGEADDLEIVELLASTRLGLGVGGAAAASGLAGLSGQGSLAWLPPCDEEHNAEGACALPLDEDAVMENGGGGQSPPPGESSFLGRGGGSIEDSVNSSLYRHSVVRAQAWVKQLQVVCQDLLPQVLEELIRENILGAVEKQQHSNILVLLPGVPTIKDLEERLQRPLGKASGSSHSGGASGGGRQKRTSILELHGYKVIRLAREILDAEEFVSRGQHSKSSSTSSHGALPGCGLIEVPLVSVEELLQAGEELLGSAPTRDGANSPAWSCPRPLLESPSGDVLLRSSWRVVPLGAKLKNVEEFRRTLEESETLRPDLNISCSPHQSEVFTLQFQQQRCIFLATTIAQTSLTLPDCGVVIDSGLHKTLLPPANPASTVSTPSTAPQLSTAWISRATAEQRAGRTGRTCCGVVIRVFPRWIHDSLPPTEGGVSQCPAVLRGGGNVGRGGGALLLAGCSTTAPSLPVEQVSQRTVAQLLHLYEKCGLACASFPKMVRLALPGIAWPETGATQLLEEHTRMGFAARCVKGLPGLARERTPEEESAAPSADDDEDERDETDCDDKPCNEIPPPARAGEDGPANEQPPQNDFQALPRSDWVRALPVDARYAPLVFCGYHLGALVDVILIVATMDATREGILRSQTAAEFFAQTHAAPHCDALTNWSALLCSLELWRDHSRGGGGKGSRGGKKGRGKGTDDGGSGTGGRDKAREDFFQRRSCGYKAIFNGPQLYLVVQKIEHIARNLSRHLLQQGPPDTHASGQRDALQELLQLCESGELDTDRFLHLFSGDAQSKFPKVLGPLFASQAGSAFLLGRSAFTASQIQSRIESFLPQDRPTDAENVFCVCDAAESLPKQAKWVSNATQEKQAGALMKVERWRRDGKLESRPSSSLKVGNFQLLHARDVDFMWHSGNHSRIVGREAPYSGKKEMEVPVDSYSKAQTGKQCALGVRQLGSDSMLFEPVLFQHDEKTGEHEQSGSCSLRLSSCGPVSRSPAEPEAARVWKTFVAAARSDANLLRRFADKFDVASERIRQKEERKRAQIGDRSRKRSKTRRSGEAKREASEALCDFASALRDAAADAQRGVANRCDNLAELALQSDAVLQLVLYVLKHHVLAPVPSEVSVLGHESQATTTSGACVIGGSTDTSATPSKPGSSVAVLYLPPLANALGLFEGGNQWDPQGVLNDDTLEEAEQNDSDSSSDDCASSSSEDHSGSEDGNSDRNERHCRRRRPYDDRAANFWPSLYTAHQLDSFELRASLERAHRNMTKSELAVAKRSPKITAKVSRNRVVLIHAQTGTGKSTCVPLQIAYDAIIGKQQVARIAVIEPRRETCKTLYNRARHWCEAEAGAGALSEECPFAYRIKDDIATDRDKTAPVVYMTPEYFYRCRRDSGLMGASPATPAVTRRQKSGHGIIIVKGKTPHLVESLPSQTLLQDYVAWSETDVTARKKKKSKIDTATAMQQIIEGGGSSRLAHALDVYFHHFPPLLRWLLGADGPIWRERVGGGSNNTATKGTRHLSRVQQMGGKILVFLPGDAEIRQCYNALVASSPFLRRARGLKEELQQDLNIEIRVSEIHGQLGHRNALACNELVEAGCLHILLSTNVCETGLTIQKLFCVIDTGMQKKENLHLLGRQRQLMREWAQPSQCTQRKGRLGRVCPGLYIPVYPACSVASLRDDVLAGMRRTTGGAGQVVEHLIKDLIAKNLLKTAEAVEHRDDAAAAVSLYEAAQRDARAYLRDADAVTVTDSKESENAAPATRKDETTTITNYTAQLRKCSLVPTFFGLCVQRLGCDNLLIAELVMKSCFLDMAVDGVIVGGILEALTHTCDVDAYGVLPGKVDADFFESKPSVEAFVHAGSAKRLRSELDGRREEPRIVCSQDRLFSSEVLDVRAVVLQMLQDRSFARMPPRERRNFEFHESKRIDRVALRQVLDAITRLGRSLLHVIGFPTEEGATAAAGGTQARGAAQTRVANTTATSTGGTVTPTVAVAGAGGASAVSEDETLGGGAGAHGAEQHAASADGTKAMKQLDNSTEMEAVLQRRLQRSVSEASVTSRGTTGTTNRNDAKSNASARLATEKTKRQLAGGKLHVSGASLLPSDTAKLAWLIAAGKFGDHAEDLVEPTTKGIEKAA
eukprot:g8183.t1